MGRLQDIKERQEVDDEIEKQLKADEEKQREEIEAVQEQQRDAEQTIQSNTQDNSAKPTEQNLVTQQTEQTPTDKPNIAQSVYDKGINKQTLDELGHQKGYDYASAKEQTPSLVDMIHSGNSFVDAYRKTHVRPTEPEYDAKREKALRWQQAMISLGKLGGIISDTVAANSGSPIIYDKSQGQAETDYIGSQIKGIRDTFSNQYATYLDADKMYLNGLYDAYKLDNQERIRTGKDLAKKFDLDQTYKYSDLDSAIDVAKARMANRGRGKNGRDYSITATVGNYPVTFADKYQYDAFVDAITGYYFSPSKVNAVTLKDFIREYGYDTSSINLQNMSISELEKFLQKADATKWREHYQNYVKNMGKEMALNYAASDYSPKVLQIAENAAQLQQGSIRRMQEALADMRYAMHEYAREHNFEYLSTFDETISQMTEDELRDMYKHYYGKDYRKEDIDALKRDVGNAYAIDADGNIIMNPDTHRAQIITDPYTVSIVSEVIKKTGNKKPQKPTDDDDDDAPVV